MAEEVILPKTGIYNDDVTLIEWLVAEGAEVHEGEVLFTMQTDKVEIEVEASSPGWLRQLVPAETTLPLGSRVGLIAVTRQEYEDLGTAGI